MECTICLEYKEDIFKLNCKHSICTECLDKLNKTILCSGKCPLCRNFYFYNNKKLFHQDKQLSNIMSLIGQ